MKDWIKPALFGSAIVVATVTVTTAWAAPKPAAAPTVQHVVNVGKPGVAPSGAPGNAPGAPAPAATQGASSTDLGGPPTKRVLKRNPFVPITTRYALQAESSSERSQPKTPASQGKKPAAQVEAVPVPMPEFALMGIFTAHGWPAALITTPLGKATVRVGDVVQGYKVTKIDLGSRQVLVEMRKHAFRLSMPRYTPKGLEAGGGGSKGGAPQTGEGSSMPMPSPPAPAPGGGPGGKGGN